MNVWPASLPDGIAAGAGALRPRFSVVIEGYNEALGLGSTAATLAALHRQGIAPTSIEVIVVGSPAEPHGNAREASPFFAVRRVAADGAHYYQLKNIGVRAAQGDIVVLADSDVVPEPGWLEAIEASIDAGADYSAGLTRFAHEGRGRWPAWLLDIAASISWGFTLGRSRAGAVEPRGFLSHNVAFRREVLATHPFPEEFGRTCGGSVLYARLCRDGVRGVLNVRQRVRHAFSFRWWLSRLHPRFGYEVFRLRRLGSSVVDVRASRLGWFEPIVTMAWHTALDVPQWLRYSAALGWGCFARLAALPVLVCLSLAARSSEMAAMYRTMIAPARMEAFALRS